MNASQNTLKRGLNISSGSGTESDIKRKQAEALPLGKSMKPESHFSFSKWVIHRYSMDTRPSWDKYFIEIAERVASRSTCLRLKVGAVLVAEDNRILATGYNGSPKGTPHCIDVGCLKNEEGRCVRTIHAEVNAILSVDMLIKKNSIIYCTHEPCDNCTKLIIQAGIKKVVFKNLYANSNSNNSHFSPYIKWVQYKD